MKKLIYVAGGSTERLTVVRPRMAQVVAAGWELTHDWTTCEGYDGPFPPEAQHEAALLDLEGIRRADVVWFLWPEKHSEGIGVELGYALALFPNGVREAKHLVVSGPFFGRCIFAGLVQHAFETHGEALAHILAR